MFYDYVLFKLQFTFASIKQGNSRIKRLSPNLDFEEHITNEGLEGRLASENYSIKGNY